MNAFSIAAAQSCSIKGDIESNVRTHAEYVRVAVEYNVDVIVFPELSLTGYEPEIAREVVITLDDERLVSLREQVRQFDITIIAGAPIACPEGKPYIGALILNSDNSHVYRKQHLHPGEEDFFSPSPGRLAGKVVWWMSKEWRSEWQFVRISITRHMQKKLQGMMRQYILQVC